MEKLGFSKLVAGIALAVATLPAMAADITGNGAPSGSHYQLNIIGVDKAKKDKVNMTDSNRRTIFVPLQSTRTGVTSGDGTAIVDSQIWLTPGRDFQVCDGNGFDEANGCDDGFDSDWNYLAADGVTEVVSTKNGAVFQLPCNTNLNGESAWIDHDNDPATADVEVQLDYLVSCNEAVTVDGQAVPWSGGVPTANYQVWARALGSPKNASATMTTCATVNGELQCSLENEVLTRSKGRSTFTDVTNELTSLVVAYCDGVTLGTGECDGTLTYTRIALFAGNTEDWFWNYDNNGLRLAQLRFYDVQ